ncbi:MAG: hypothetical protein LZ158_03360 [Thaumarchaeota archaeon]|jgi:riboflavin transporter FmnP|nr:hypothetical protein [Candidatus Terraquivivens yellowstonensis]MCL7392217.1 hypothetical protein [Candidatus Terraquivivens yellowstonensis]MCL7397447.1 hypothetical protein [Candidatus Terraquivivens yellowstonensis]MCL7400442.1 hypothetical protein [Candidatus Terraquivivens yellowstonensis]
MERERPSRSLLVAVAAVFGGLSSAIAMLRLSFPFPLLPYLKFDLAEIPVVFSFLAFGPSLGLLTSLVYWIVLTIVTTGEWLWPIGPSMKFLAVVSTLMGVWLGSRVLVKECRLGSLLLRMGTLAALARVVTMGAMNYVILVIAVPESLAFVNSLLSMTLGLKLGSELELILLVMALTAAYNVIHTILSLVPPAVIVQRIERVGAFIRIAGGSWIGGLIGRTHDSASNSS